MGVNRYTGVNWSTTTTEEIGCAETKVKLWISKINTH